MGIEATIGILVTILVVGLYILYRSRPYKPVGAKACHSCGRDLTDSVHEDPKFCFSCSMEAQRVYTEEDVKLAFFDGWVAKVKQTGVAFYNDEVIPMSQAWDERVHEGK